MVTENAEQPAEACPECQVGTLRPQVIPYFASLDGALITVPDFPAWICDVCHHCEYDEAALDDLRAVLGPKASLPKESSRRRFLAPEETPAWLVQLHRRRDA